MQVPLKTCLPFLKGSLQSGGEQRRNAAIVRSLRRAENLGVREEGIKCKQRCAIISTSNATEFASQNFILQKCQEYAMRCRSVVVSFERACRLCHKRIGSAAFVAYPGGPLAHYSCYKRDEPPSSEAGSRAQAPMQVYDISL